MKFDDVFTDLSSAAGIVRTEINDPHTGRILELTFDEAFAQCVVYNPPHREAICIEPYTAAPDAFTLEAQGVKTGLKMLQPGESFKTRFEIRLK
jgi:aldose 1-epimerase